MTDETKALDEFLGDLKDNADSDPLKPSEDNPFSPIEDEEKEPEKGETVVEEPKDEKPLPFHKDPKVQRYIEREIAKRIPEPETEEIAQNDYFEGVVKAFEAAVGNDTPEKITLLSEMKNAFSNLDERAAQKAINRLESARQEEVEIEKEYENKLSDGFEVIEEETGVDLYAPENKKLRVRFIDFVERVAPKQDGEISELPDIGETFKAFQSISKPQTQTPRAKELASKSMERSGEVTQQKPSERITWDNIGEKIAETLGM